MELEVTRAGVSAAQRELLHALMELADQGPVRSSPRNRITVRINGNVVNDYVDEKGTFTKGHIGIECYDSKAKSVYRKLEVKELPTAGW